MERASKGQLTGEQLFEFYRSQKSEYASIVKMLPYAAGSFEKAYQILEECQRENKRLFAFYPGIDITSAEIKPRLNEMEPVGSIIDGLLCIIPAKSELKY